MRLGGKLNLSGMVYICSHRTAEARSKIAFIYLSIDFICLCRHDEIILMQTLWWRESTNWRTDSQLSQKFGTSSISKFGNGRQSQNPITFTCRLSVVGTKRKSRWVHQQQLIQLWGHRTGRQPFVYSDIDAPSLHDRHLAIRMMVPLFIRSLIIHLSHRIIVRDKLQMISLRIIKIHRADMQPFVYSRIDFQP